MRKLLLPLILLCVALAFALGAYFVLIYLHKPRSAEVIVAKSNITSGSLITPETLSTIPWSGKEFPEGFIDIKDKTKVLNRVAAVDIVRGSPICEGCLAPVGSPMGVFGKIPTGMRALTVKVDEVSGVAGFIKPGSRVDVVLAANNKGSEGKEEKGSKIILQNVLVLAAGPQFTQLEGKDKPQVVNTVTLLLSPAEAEKLALATKMGALSLSLRCGLDNAPVKTRGALPPDVWGEQDPDGTMSVVELIQGGVKTQVRVVELMAGEEKKDVGTTASMPTPSTLAKGF